MVAWLVTNSMRSETIQFLQLQIQVITNLWRKSAFRALLGSKIPNQQNRRTESMLTTRFHASKLTGAEFEAAMADIPDILKEDAMTAGEVQTLPKMDKELLFLWMKTFVSKLPREIASLFAMMIPPPLLEQMAAQGVMHKQLSEMRLCLHMRPDATY